MTAGHVPKIMCTLGTTTDDPTILAGMKQAGMAAARINTIHGTIDDLARRIEEVHTLAGVEVYLDLKGPQIRLHTNQNYAISQGDSFPVYFQEHGIWFNHAAIKIALRPGLPVFIENGEVQAEIVKIKTDYAVLKVIAPASFTLHNNMGVNLPGCDLAQASLPSLTPRDKDAIQVGIAHNVHGFALSFVRSYSQVAETAAYIDQELKAASHSQRPAYLLKIEDPVGVRNLPYILGECKQAGVRVIALVARGDLFTEIPHEDLPIVQETLVATCRAAGVPVMVGTGIFATMQRRPAPSRAEFLDLYHMCKEGIDWVLLSDETSNSKHPVDAVRALQSALVKYSS